MTAIVGILCKDGVVIGSDSSSTFVAGQKPTIEQKSKKIHIVENQVVIAGTGQVGLGQRFIGIVQKAIKDKAFEKLNYLDIGRLLSANTISDFGSTGMRPGQYGALLAYAHKNEFYLCEFAVQDFQPEWKTDRIWYVSMGSGQFIADPFLGFMRRIFMKDSMPKIADAIFMATWTLDYAIELNPGGINGPIDIAVLRMDDDGRNIIVKTLEEEDLQEHMDNIADLETHIEEWKRRLTGEEKSPDIPDLETGQL